MRVVAPDMRGHGMSDGPENMPYAMQGLVNDLELVLDRLEVQGPFYLLAHSFGGAIATEYALLHPEDVKHRLIAAQMSKTLLSFNIPPAQQIFPKV